MLDKRFAVFPGTFDPMTHGHRDLIVRASQIFDDVIVAVAESAGKKPLFSWEKRIELVREVLKPFPHIEVAGFNTLLVDFAKSKGAHVVIRGLRTVTDYEYELQLANMNRCLDGSLETIFLTPGEPFAFISSSLVREIAMYGGDVSNFVPEVVAQALRSLPAHGT